jgi:hypothetical protein
VSIFCTSKSRDLAPATAAALLSLAPLSVPSVLADQNPLLSLSETTYHSQRPQEQISSADILRLRTFVEVVASCDLAWPSRGYRMSVLKDFEKNGTLNELSLAPTEQAALMHVARYGWVAVQHSLSAANRVAEQGGPVAAEELFSLLRNADSVDRAAAGVALQSHPPEAERLRGIRLVLLLAAHRELMVPDSLEKEKKYLQSVDSAKCTELKLLSGGLLLSRHFKGLNPDHSAVLGLIKGLAPTVTAEDREHISFLQMLPPSESKLRVVPLVLAACGALALMWKSGRKVDGAQRGLSNATD